MQFFTAKQIADAWHVSVQQVRRYCKEGRIKSAFQYEGQWLIPENAKPPEIQNQAENDVSPLMKQVRYQMERNNHFGIYEYIQVNLAYSSSRMASNRLTRGQVEEMYRRNYITPAFEASKVDDIIEVANHFIALRYALENVDVPLTAEFIKHIHYLLVHGTYSDKRNRVAVGAFRGNVERQGVPPEKINKELTLLLQKYEKRDANLEQILDFHVQLERIRPFDDYNGRVGRILMMKECLRYDVEPFIIDDKRRGNYNRGIALWDTNPEILRTVVREAQDRFESKLITCRLMQYHRSPPNCQDRGER